MSTSTEGIDPSETALVDALLRSLWRTQFVTSLIAGICCVIAAIFIARWLTHSDIEELKRLIQANASCQCADRAVSARAAGGAVTILPDGNAFGALTREVLRHQGQIDDVPGTSGGTDDKSR